MTFKHYPIYKKRDGQSFELVSTIYQDSWKNAKKEFAENMTKDNWELSNNVQWLDKDEDGVFETGWYDFNAGSPLWDEEKEKYDPNEAEDFLMVTEKDINKGFSNWNEDVYTWELRKK